MILDTDVLGALSAGRYPRRMRDEVERAGALCTTAINWAEVCYGIARRMPPHAGVLRDRYSRLVRPFVQTLDFDEMCAEICGRLRADLERRGVPLNDTDLMIASIALRHDLTLVTGNTRHFSRLPGLKLENWLTEDE